MSITLKSYAAHVSEEECLGEVMRLRFGAVPCPACDATHGFARARRHGAFACRACGYSVYPLQGTPLSRLEGRLREAFVAARLTTAGQGPGRIARALGLSRKAAEPVLAAVADLRTRPAALDPKTSWLDAMATFAFDRLDGAGPTAAPAAPAKRESVWQTTRSLLRPPNVETTPLAGVAAIAVLALVGAGIGWLLVPAAPEEDGELAQATATLSLADDKPVIIVSADVADQLYEVSDLDGQTGSPLATSIRVAAPRSAGGGATTLAETRPMNQPKLNFSTTVGQQLVRGDLSAVKSGAASRPELALYGSLAREIEAGRAGNPDDLLLFGPMKIRRYLVEKIVRAGSATATDPVLLMAIADKESAFRTEVQAQTSSASGLYQFIERTWLGVVRDFGGRYGLEKEAKMLAEGDVAGPERARILDLRRDPYLSAVMAGEMLKRDSLRIQRKLGRPLTGGEVYLVHFLGPDGAERLIDQVTRQPEAVAAAILPKPAAANPSIFYAGSAGGQKAVSVTELHGKFETMMTVRLDRYRAVKSSRGPENSGRPP